MRAYVSNLQYSKYNDFCKNVCSVRFNTLAQRPGLADHLNGFIFNISLWKS